MVDGDLFSVLPAILKGIKHHLWFCLERVCFVFPVGSIGDVDVPGVGGEVLEVGDWYGVCSVGYIGAATTADVGLGFDGVVHWISLEVFYCEFEVGCGDGDVFFVVVGFWVEDDGCDWFGFKAEGFLYVVDAVICVYGPRISFGSFKTADWYGENAILDVGCAAGSDVGLCGDRVVHEVVVDVV